MPVSTTTSTTGGGTATSFSNTPQAKDDVFNLTEDTVSLVASSPSATVISLDVLANDGGGAAKSLYSIDDGESASTATKTYAPIDLTKAETWTAGVSAWEPSGTDGILIRLNALTGKVEMDLTGYLALNGYSSLQALGAGDSIHETFTYAIRLANGTLSWAKAEVHIVGTNDAAVITGQCRAELTESDLPQMTGGKLNVSDIDGADVFVAQSGVAGSNGYGTFSIDADGNWTYQMTSAHDAFKAGVDYTDSITVETADGTAKVITVTIHGSNDAPELTGAQPTLDGGTEEQHYTIDEADLLAGFTDAEGDALSVSNLSVDNGTLHDNGDGTWTFTPNADFHGAVSLSYNVIDGNGGSVAATQTFGIANVEDEATGNLAVDGTAEEGGALTASLSDLSDVDGTASVTAYRWQEKIDGIWTDISGQDGTTLNIPDDQSYVGKQVRVIVTSTDALGGQTEFTSDLQTIVNVEDEATGSLAIGGDAEEGGTLTADTSGLSDEDGDLSFAYQWQLDGVDIDGATSDTLGVPDDQSYVGHDVTLKVTTTDPFDGTTDFSTTTTIANVEDEATGTVGVTGAAEEGGSLTADASGLVDEDGGIQATTYQWQEKVGESWVDIGGQDDATLSIPSDQSYVGKEVRAVATTTDAFGGTTSIASASQIIANVNDAPTVSLTNVLASTAENGGVIKVADIVVSDVDGGTNVLSLSGADAGAFTIVGNELRFNGGANFEAKPNYDVTVNVNDASVGGNPDDSESFTLAISDVVEAVPAGSPSTFNGTGDTNDFDTLNSGSTDGSATGLTLTGSSNGSKGDTLHGSNANDSINADNGPDTVYGHGGNDTSLGGNQGDTVYGQEGNDSVSGGADPDFIYGGSGADLINGDGQADFIYGGSGKDTINGGGGPDTIVGGFGDDVIDLGDTDGASDTIAYIDLRDTNDSITGFVSGSDKIDLLSINSGDADQAFNWGGQQAGPIVEANSVTWYTTGGNVVVLADTDGDLNTAEFSITLLGITSITSSDVIL